MIEPKILKGFRDALPAEEIKRRNMIAGLESNFKSFGFVPIDTPALEYTEVLLGKGGGETDKQIFRFRDNGERDVALRFDLTVPFARYMAMHNSETSLPFKRYHIAKVWRGENTQKGRYREFYQCDFDTVGCDNAIADAEIVSVIYTSLKALNVGDFRIFIAHRGIFNEFLDSIGERENSVEILRTVDKLRKIGAEEVKKLLSEITGSEAKADRILAYITVDTDSFEGRLDKLVSLCGRASESSARLREVYKILCSLGMEKAIVLDPSITRGLDYYTGLVFETFLSGNESIGSVCSGGRYNNLASLYSKEMMPGVGASVGLDRLMAALPDDKNTVSSADLIILNESEIDSPLLLKTALSVRNYNLKVFVFPQTKKIIQQYKYAEINNIPFALSVKNGTYQLKNLATRATVELGSPEAVAQAVIKELT